MMEFQSAVLGGPQSNTTGATESNTWLKLAQDAYRRSTNYSDANYRKGFEDNLRLFQSKHPKDSKYVSDAYKYRSRIFRPKTRSVLRKNEATAALAFFSNPDVVTIDPQDEENMMEVASSEIMQALLNYRLTKTIPWFLTLIGGFQDAMTVGLVCSMQIWRYRQTSENEKKDALMPDGSTVQISVPKITVIEDKPCVDLFPIENIRFDPAAHWYDVVSTSPYVILQIPMYVNDVLDNMESDDKQGNSWKKLAKSTILEARITGLDPLRQARNDNKQDPEAVTSDINEFDVVMVHLNFIKTGEKTYVYYTLKDTHLLSEPMLVEEMFLHCADGRPPVQIGFCVIETHKAIPTSIVGLTKELQLEANEIANQRMDNVKFVLNKRYLTKRGANIDIEGLLKNVPGGVTQVNNVNDDVKEVNWQDVTSSAYQEQNLVNNDFDDLAGNFAQSSVQTNRSLNETVGGMRLMAQGANMLTEYTIRVLVETWVEPVLRQLVKMEQAYETDETILAIAGKKSPAFQKFGVNQVTDSLLNQELTLSVNVGMGATDPEQRLQRFQSSMGLYTQISQAATPDLDLNEIRKTLFGLAGFKDAAKFFNNQVDPRIAKLMDALQQAQSEGEKVVMNAKEGIMARQQQLDVREMQLNQREASGKNVTDLIKTDMKNNADLEGKAMTGAVTLEVARIGASKDGAEGTTPEAGTDVIEMMRQIIAGHENLKQLMESPRETMLQMGPNGEPVGSISRVKKPPKLPEVIPVEKPTIEQMVALLQRVPQEQQQMTQTLNNPRQAQIRLGPDGEPIGTVGG